MIWHHQAVSEQGGRPSQQDRIGVFDSPDGTATLAVLADGLGGHQDGAGAAQVLLEIAESSFQRALAVGDFIPTPGRFLERICESCHDRLLSESGVEDRGSATTCVLLLLFESEAWWVHVGDSRLYHFRSGELVFHTRDHTVANTLEKSGTRSGTRSGNGAGSCPTTLGQLTMCLGGQNPVVPESGSMACDQFDRFLLCSDGAWSLLDSDDLGKIANGNEDQGDIIRRALGGTPGEADNASLIALQASPVRPAFGLVERVRRLFAPAG